MCAPDNWRNTYSRVNSLHSGHSLEHQIKNIKSINRALNDEYIVYDPNLSRSMIINESMMNASLQGDKLADGLALANQNSAETLNDQK